MRNRLLTPVALLLVALVSSSSLLGQAKVLLELDTAVLNNVSLLTAMDLVETGIPGREFALAGSITGRDSTNNFRQSIFCLQFDQEGVPMQYDEYEDKSTFLFQGPRAFSLCYDGVGSFYFAIGSNSRQVIVKGTQGGQLEWAVAQHHHEFYSALCDGGGVTFLGQDESQQGLHDFSISKLDPNGQGGMGMMYGTVDFELPEKMVRGWDGGYVMGGSSAVNGSFWPMVVRVDEDLQLVWGKRLIVPDKRAVVRDVVMAPDSSGYIFTGYVQNAIGPSVDSLLLFKLDTAGNVAWANIYGNAFFQELAANSLAVSPEGELFMAGSCRDTGYRYPFLARVDADGNLMAFTNYDDFNPNTEEYLNGVIYHAPTQKLYAVGEHNTVLPNFQLEKRLVILHAYSDLRVGCDSNVALTTRAVVLRDSLGLFEEPYQVVDTFPFMAHTGAFTMDTSCFTLVGVALPDQMPYSLKFRNPAGADWALDYVLPEGGGMMEWLDLNGRVLVQRRLEAGEGRVYVDLGQMASGLYLMRVRGEDWVSKTHKVLRME